MSEVNPRKNSIEQLFEGEELPSIHPQTQPAPLDLTPSQEILEQTKNQQRPEDKRQFTRVDVSQKKLELKFNNELQFARQYIENISLGGLFVKTNAQPPMGSIVPIEFSVPSPDAEEGIKAFRLEGKVCRVSPHGVGLEFVDLSATVRHDLECYVKSILPEGTPLSPRAKKASIEHLDAIREKKTAKNLEWRKRRQKIGIIVVLLGINLLFVNEMVQDVRIERAQRSNNVQIKDRTIRLAQIRSVSRDSKGSFNLDLDDKTSVELSEGDIRALPEYLQQSLKLIRSIPPVEKKRRSKNAPGRVRLQHR